jgi:hypothetical protein
MPVFADLICRTIGAKEIAGDLQVAAWRLAHKKSRQSKALAGFYGGRGKD